MMDMVRIRRRPQTASPERQARTASPERQAGIRKKRGMETGRRMKVVVVKETSPGERRVALVPDAIARLQPAGIDVLVESGAGDGAWLTDASYAAAGASIVSAAEIYRTADVIFTVTRPQAGCGEGPM